MRALPFLLAALIVASVAVGAAGGFRGPAPDDGVAEAAPSTPTVADVGSDTVAPQVGDADALQQITVLDVPPETVARSSVDEHYVDLGPAVGLSANATTDRLRTLSTVERIEAAETDATRRERLRTAIRELETRVDGLDRRQTAAVEAYARDERSARELLVALTRISIAAEELDTRRSRIERLAADTTGFDINQGRLASVGNRLSAFAGPVRAHAREVLLGETDPHRFYVAVGPESVTVTTVLGDTYLRESYRGDLRDGNGDPIELEEALEVVATSYPVIWNTTREQTQVFGGGETYPVTIAHSRGRLTAFVDSDARLVYAEHQRRPLDSMVADQRREQVVDGRRVFVNHTYPGGPVRISVVDETTGDPVDARISLLAGPGEATSLGTTGSDGVHWMLSPDGRYTVIVDGREEAGVVVSPGAPPRMALADGPATGPGGNASTVTATPGPTTGSAVASTYKR
jgi:hypothetical protein